MPALTPEQEMLQTFAIRAIGGDPWYTTDDLLLRENGELRLLVQDANFIAAARPAAILAILAQLEAVQEAPTEKPDWWKEMLAAVMRELPRNMGRWKDGNAPGHCHDVPGIWDSDNGAKAGTTCAWCLVWNKAKNELDAAPSVPTQTGTLICQKCGVDRAKEPCKREHWQGCGMAGTAHNATAPGEPAQ